MPKQREPGIDTYEKSVGWYTAYLCGVLDTLAVFKNAVYAVDATQIIKETVESIIKDAWVLCPRGRGE